ncbi:MAG: hypothetical protein N7Q72_06990, partial [Spiroplasma sp. Tabriz.8]|nr:hypothetical protein [Spiroplasma sp. Tabriz.8]
DFVYTVFWLTNASSGKSIKTSKYIPQYKYVIQKKKIYIYIYIYTSNIIRQNHMSQVFGDFVW